MYNDYSLPHSKTFGIYLANGYNTSAEVGNNALEIEKSTVVVISSCSLLRNALHFVKYNVASSTI